MERYSAVRRTRSTSHARDLVCLVDNTVKKRRYEADTLLGTSFQKIPMDEDSKKKLKAKKPKKTQMDEVVEMDTVVVEPVIRHLEPVSNKVTVKPQKPSSMQLMIRHLYQTWGSPNWEEIHDKKLVTAARKALYCSKGSYGYIKRELMRLASGQTSMERRGRPNILEKDGVEVELIASSTSLGLSYTDATVLVNEIREDRGMKSVSPSTVRKAAKMTECIQTSRRQSKKSGKMDSESEWAKSRKLQCLQMKRQLQLGAGATAILGDPPPLYLDGIAFWDEHHRKIILGHVSKFETRVSRDEDGLICKVEDGGRFPAPSPATDVKYPNEARGCFGVAMTRKGGKLEGVRLTPFNYTNRWVVGVEKYEKLIHAELNRVLPLKGVWGKPGMGYAERYGEDWRHFVETAVNATHCCITEIMEHVIAYSTAAFADTDRANDFVIFHDALSAWWEVGAQEFMTKLGFKDRQIRILPGFGEKNRYTGKLVGDSPELCRGLDSHGFADLKRSMIYHCSLSTKYSVDDPRRFLMGTPQQVWRTMTRCWSLEPRSQRIIQDISALPRILDKIIEADGCIVPVLLMFKISSCNALCQDENLRSGRRGQNLKGLKLLKGKPRLRNRVGTLTAKLCHEDCLEARIRIKRDAFNIIKLRQANLMKQAECKVNENVVVSMEVV